MTDTLAVWQPRYAERGVPLFPVKITAEQKRPCVRGYLYTDVARSAQFALAFPDAEAFGFPCGSRSRLTVLDLDSKDPAIIGEGEGIFGESPLVWRTGSGNFAAAYRHRGEQRRIRPIPSLPIDLLGGGYCVAPPSMGTVGRYEFIRGSLADIDRLPAIRLPEQLRRPQEARRPRDAVSHGRRNDTMFRYALQQARHVDDLEALIDVVQTRNQESCVDPLSIEEISRLAASAWRYQQQGRNFIAGGGNLVVNTFEEVDTLAAVDPDAFALLCILRRYHYGHDRFTIAKIMAKNSLGWTGRRFSSARDLLLDRGLIVCVHKGGRGVGDVSLYRMP
jgi:hypothetical protein